MVLNIDTAHLPFQEENGRRKQILKMVASLDDAGGNFVTGGMGAIVFNLKETAYAAMAKRGQPLAVEMKLGAPPGRYQPVPYARHGLNGTFTVAAALRRLTAALNVFYRSS